MAQTHYWFDRRNLGQLLVPVTWQAFVLIGIQALVVGMTVVAVLDAGSTGMAIAKGILGFFALCLTFCVAIAKSPMPHWLRHSLGD
jgi:hypothetical protein